MADPTAPRKPRRLWRFAFAASLALNLAVVGLVVGFAFRGGPFDGRPPALGTPLGPIAGALDRDDRREIGRSLRGNPALRGRHGGPDLEAVRAALRATPFDPDALTRAMAEGEARRDAIILAATTALVERVSQMSDAERAAFAARIGDRRGGRDGSLGRGGP